MGLCACRDGHQLRQAQPHHRDDPGQFSERAGLSGRLATRLRDHASGFDPDDQVWQEVFNIPAGEWEYKAALNDSWDENYGANAERNGPNIGLSLPAVPGNTAPRTKQEQATSTAGDGAAS